MTEHQPFTHSLTHRAHRLSSFTGKNLCVNLIMIELRHFNEDIKLNNSFIPNWHSYRVKLSESLAKWAVYAIDIICKHMFLLFYAFFEVGRWFVFLLFYLLIQQINRWQTWTWTLAISRLTVHATQFTIWLKQHTFYLWVCVFALR